MSSGRSSALVGWYRTRIGEPTTADEAYGYWAFAAGVVVGVVGILAFLASATASTLRAASIVLSAVALVLLIAGPVVRLPLRKRATSLTYLGALVCLVAVGWFYVTWPAAWAGGGIGAEAKQVITLYGVGVLLMGGGGILVPILTGPREERERLEAERAESAERAADLEDELAAREAELEAVRASQARFELYEDRVGEYRWRLRHRNGNIVADSGEGYASRQKAQQGIQSVRRNALGAELLRVEPATAEVDEADPEEAEEVPAFEPESRATFEVYEDAAGEWRWRLVHENGNVLADSGEGYSSRSAARKGVESVRTNAAEAEVTES